jgi:YggT family protein
MSGIHDGLLFLIHTLFDLYLVVLVLRALLALAGANYFDPITQFIIRCTAFIVNPVRKIIPNYRRIETSTLVIIFCLELIKYTLIGFLNLHTVSMLGLLILSLGDALKFTLQIFLYTIIIQAILSWVQPNSQISLLLYKISSPIMRPIQRIIPPVGGIDITPIPAMILLQLLMIMIVNPLMTAGFAAMMN